MVALTARVKFYLYAQATDMRKSFDGLSGVVTSALGRDPTNGDVYVFVNRRRDRMKLLVWDHTGFWLFYKRLEQGTFQLPRHEAESTLCDWVKASCELLKPLSEALRDEILRATYLMADETPMRVLDSGQPGKCHLGYDWVYYDPLRKLAYFDYQPSRSRDGPQQFLKNFAEHLQTDGYAAYEAITRRPEVTALGCMAHARRQFVEAKDSDPARAEWMLSQIQQLYEIERQARAANLSHDERYRLRQVGAQPILLTIKAWLDQQGREVLPKSVMGKAIGYTLGQWP